MTGENVYLVPLKVEIKFKPRPQNRILVSLRGLFQNLRRVHPSVILYGSPTQGFFVVLPIVSSLIFLTRIIKL